MEPSSSSSFSTTGFTGPTFRQTVSSNMDSTVSNVRQYMDDVEVCCMWAMWVRQAIIAIYDMMLFNGCLDILYIASGVCTAKSFVGV
jgi:hypothetical protein